MCRQEERTQKRAVELLKERYSDTFVNFSVDIEDGNGDVWYNKTNFFIWNFSSFEGVVAAIFEEQEITQAYFWDWLIAGGT